jgi:hypothetical protein
MSGQLHASSILDTRKRVPGNHWIGGRTVPTAGLEVRVSSKRQNCGESFRIPSAPLYSL